MSARSFNIELKGAKELIALLAKAGPGGLREVKWAMNEEAQLIFEESQKQVPKAIGTLQRSGVLEPIKTTPTGLEIEIWYGGQAKDYALRLHEVPMKHYTKDGSKSHYLSDPVKAREKDYIRRIGERLNRGIKSG